MSNLISYALLKGNRLTKREIFSLLDLNEKEAYSLLFPAALKLKKEALGTKIFVRGLIEVSNRCAKDCLYCGIRSGNQAVLRYEMNEEEVEKKVKFSYENRLGSVVLQTGERTDKNFVDHVDRIIRSVKRISHNTLRITLSCGEQEKEVYKRWHDSGAERYLLRIETSNSSLYKKIHPENNNHSFEKRVACLEVLKETGYQVGSGIMVGLPFQTIDDLAEDLLFLKKIDVDMVGLGPYLEHHDTPLYKEAVSLVPSRPERLLLTLKVIAVLRIIMKDINIASTTALRTIDPKGLGLGMKAGANVFMVNLTPEAQQKKYFLYEGKPLSSNDAHSFLSTMSMVERTCDEKIAYGEYGDSLHYRKRNREC